jgi:hypothetical protein
MEIGIYEQEYGQFCLCHSKQYNGMTIDKITFTVPKYYFRKDIFQREGTIKNPFFYIEYCHNQYYKLHIQGESINPTVPMLQSVMQVFDYTAMNGIFLAETNRRIQKIMAKRDSGFNNCCSEFLRFLHSARFIFSEIELAFDFFDCQPLQQKNTNALSAYKNSSYSRDFKRYYRNEFSEDDGYGKRSHKTRESILAVYNRGHKLNVPEIIWRVEWRIRDERAARMLDISDLRLNMKDFIYSKGHRIRKITNYRVSLDSLEFNWAYIKNHFPVFALLTTG